MSEIDTAALDALTMELSGRHGPEEAITAEELSTILNENTKTSPKTRQAVKEVMRQTYLPVLGTYAGYCLPRNDREAAEEVRRLESRIEGIREKQRLIVENWQHQREVMGIAADDPEPREAADDSGSEDEATSDTTLEDFTEPAMATDGGQPEGSA